MNYRSFVTISLVLLVSCCLTAPTALAASTAAATKPAKAATKKTTAPKVDDAFEEQALDQGAFQTEEEHAKEAAADESGGGSFLRMIFGLVVVLGAIYGVHWMLKKWSQARVAGVGGSGSAGIIDVVATTPLTAGRQIHLIRVGGELVLVGATEQSITRLGAFDQADLASVLGSETSSKFDSLLNGALTAPKPILELPGSSTVAATAPTAAASSEPFLKRFVDNLRLSTAR